MSNEQFSYFIKWIPPEITILRMDWLAAFSYNMSMGIYASYLQENLPRLLMSRYTQPASQVDHHMLCKIQRNFSRLYSDNMHPSLAVDVQN